MVRAILHYSVRIPHYWVSIGDQNTSFNRKPQALAFLRKHNRQVDAENGAAVQAAIRRSKAFLADDCSACSIGRCQYHGA